MKCTIIDYGTGNIQSVHNALEHLGHTVTRTNDCNEIDKAECVIFPGQGAFGPAINQLNTLNLIEPLQRYIQSQRPFIGICLGFQLLFQESSEAKNVDGLKAFNGKFERCNNENIVVPHMGWNEIEVTGNSCLSDFNNQQFYFVHSYFLGNTSEKNYAITNYDIPFVSAIANQTQLITQFHPEKSGDVGLGLLKSFFEGL